MKKTKHTWKGMTEKEFRGKLSQFLFSPSGAKYKPQFKFSGELQCGKDSPPVIVSTISYQHKLFESATEWVPAMDKYQVLPLHSNLNLRLSESLIL